MLRQIIARRTFAAAAPASVKVPLTLHGIEGRYATALYTASVKTSSADAVESEFKRIQQTVKQSARIQQFLKNPTLSRTQKAEGVKQMLAKYSDLTKNFFGVLAENSRLGETEKIIESYLELMSAHRGEINVTVTTAQPLDSKLQNQLTKTLNKSPLIKKAASLKISSKVDPSILGGMVVEIGDKTIDLSISNRLTKLNKLMTDSV